MVLIVARQQCWFWHQRVFLGDREATHENREVLMSGGIDPGGSVSPSCLSDALWSRAAISNLWMNNQVVRVVDERMKGEVLEKSKDMSKPPTRVEGLSRFMQTHAEFGRDQSSGSGFWRPASTPLTFFIPFRRSRRRRRRVRGSLIVECFLAAGVKDGVEKHGATLKRQFQRQKTFKETHREGHSCSLIIQKKTESKCVWRET